MTLTPTRTDPADTGRPAGSGAGARWWSAPLRRGPDGTGPRLAALDGLRALAVTAVIVFHAFPGTFPGGFIGVDVFFVLSGFLITTGLLRERARGRIGVRRFWLRRARRLLPALALLVVGCGAALAVIGGDPAVGFGAQLVAAAGFFTNWHLIAAGNNYFAESSPPILQHLWSLAVEEQFYLVWPIALIAMMMLFPRNRTRLLAVAAAAAVSILAMAAFAAIGDIGRAYYGSDTHAFALLAGALLALARQLGLVPRRATSDLGGALALAGLTLAVLVLAGEDRTTYILGLPAVAGLTALIVATVVAGHGPLARALSVEPLRRIGVISYGLYLWHWPILIGLRYRFGDVAHDHAVLTASVAVALTLAVAAASYVWVERPIVHLGFTGYAAAIAAQVRRPGRSRAVAGVVAGALVLAGVLTTVTALRAPQETTAQQQIEAGQAAIREANAQAKAAASAHAATKAKKAKKAAEKNGDAHRGATHERSTSRRDGTATVPVGRRMTGIGDSVMLAAAPALLDRFAGIDIHAEVSRQASAVPGVMRMLKRQHRLRQVVLIGVGTNGYLGSGVLAELRRIAGPQRLLVFVNVYADREWEHSVNSQLSAYVRSDPKARLVDWRDAISAHLDDLGPDRIHPGTAGGKLYAATVAAVLSGLSGLSG
ncbi:MAG: acyltransferase family protein [Nocardioides sp.]|uniref:acyltransferase family protein n=1 Tax=Nocardioides sp. TaxID=35761 RepID=UPI0039E43312